MQQNSPAVENVPMNASTAAQVQKAENVQSDKPSVIRDAGNPYRTGGTLPQMGKSSAKEGLDQTASRSKTEMQSAELQTQMNAEKWARIESILDKYKVRPIVGVIPENRDPDFVAVADENFWEKACE